MVRRRMGDRWTGARDDWVATRALMRGVQHMAWLRLINRIIMQPRPGPAEAIRTRVLIEELYAERDPWIDAKTRHLLGAGIRHLPAGERALADGELAMIELPARPPNRLDRLARWSTHARIASVVLSLLVVGLGYEWTGTALLALLVALCIAVDAAAWLRSFASARRIWRAYLAAGGTRFWEAREPDRSRSEQ